MTSVELFHLLISIFCLWFGVTWGRGNWVNVMVKFVFIVFAIWGIIITLSDFGLVVKL